MDGHFGSNVNWESDCGCHIHADGQRDSNINGKGGVCPTTCTWSPPGLTKRKWVCRTHVFGRLLLVRLSLSCLICDCLHSVGQRPAKCWEYICRVAALCQRLVCFCILGAVP